MLPAEAVYMLCGVWQVVQTTYASFTEAIVVSTAKPAPVRAPMIVGSP